MNNVIMYCPLNDGHIMRMIQNFSLETFRRICSKNGNVFPYDRINLQGQDDFQKLICSLSPIDVNDSKIFIFDKVVADLDRKDLLDAFWEKNQMQIEQPVLNPSTENELYFVAAALMNLKTKWAAQYRAKKIEYSIDSEDSYSGTEITVAGYSLSNVQIAVDSDYKEVSAYVDLGNNLSIRLSDLTAFSSKKKKVSFDCELDLYVAICNTDFQYFHKGTLAAPRMEEELTIANHLKDIHWISDDGMYQVHVESSKALTKLKLSEKGVEARAETVATSRMVFGCSASYNKTYYLAIKHGLVVDIRYNNDSIFVAYIPQENFQTV